MPEPVEGNGGKRQTLFKVTDEPLDSRALEEAVMSEANGALVTFQGVTRRHSRGKRVSYLEYEAYRPMAEKKLQEIGQEIAKKWPIGAIAIHHRVGRLEIGETSLLVVVASPHRKEAFAACRYAVDRIKTVVPIWKKEVWEDGESWVEGEVLADEKDKEV